MNKSLKIFGMMIIPLFCTMSLMACHGGNNGEKASITILETSDIHGVLMNHDYATDEVVDRGLVQCATVINEERAIDPNLLYVDCGDIVQGNMVSEFREEAIHPAVSALNYLKCDVWELGNHEFNFEFDSLVRNIDSFNGDVISANIYKADGTRFVKPYTFKEVNGIKVAVFGILPPHINIWETDASHYNGDMTFAVPMEEVGNVLDEIEKENPDVVIGLCHYGEEGEFEQEGVGGMRQVAAQYADRVDAFLIGHEHSVLTEYFVDGEWTNEYSNNAKTVLLETGTEGAYVGKLKIELVREDGGWAVTDKSIENIPTAGKKADEGLVSLLSDVHERSIDMANTPVGTITDNFHDELYALPGIPSEVIVDGPILDLIHTVQLDNTGADVSCASLFVPDANLLAGDFLLKDGVKIYKFDNTLMVVKVTGKQLKDIMEYAAGDYFVQYKDGDASIAVKDDYELYNYDTYQGINYEIDVSQPEGERIKNIIFEGDALSDDRELRLALNNYRFGQLCAVGLINKEDCVYDSGATEDNGKIREMISQYVKENQVISPVCDSNFKIVGCPDFALGR